MMETLIKVAELVLYVFSAYLLGVIVTVPGMVIGKQMELGRGHRWPAHVAILVLGFVVYAVVFRR